MPRVPFKRIAVEEAKTLIGQGALLLDCRDHNAYGSGHLEGAQHLSSANQDGYVFSTPKTKPVVIYCYHGNASQVYAETFSDFGFQAVYSVDGGYEALTKPTCNGVANTTILSDAVVAWMSEVGFPQATFDATIDYGLTPLMKAALDGNLDIAKALIEAGAPIDATNPDGNGALWLACVGQFLPMIEFLVQAGANIDHQNDNGASCLMYSASSGRTEVVGKLIELGANIALETLDGFSAMDMAANKPCLDLLRAAAKKRA